MIYRTSVDYDLNMPHHNAGSTEEIFLQDYIEILTHSLQNLYAILTTGSSLPVIVSGS